MTRAAPLSEADPIDRHAAELGLAVIVASVQGAIGYASEAALRALGRDACESLGGLTLESLSVRPDELAEAVRELLAGARRVARELDLRRPDGSTFPCAVTLALRPAAAGHPPRIVALLVDLGACRRAEEAARATEKRYRQVFESSGTANAIFDRDCRLVLQNSRSARLLGRPAAEALGKSPPELFGPVIGPAVEARMREVLRTAESAAFETEFELDVGRRRFHSTYEPIYDDEHAVEGVQVISEDVTAARLAEETRRHGEALLAESQRTAHVGHYELDVAAGVWTSSAELDRIFGIGTAYPRDVAGWGALLHPDERAAMLAFLSGPVLRDGAPFDREYRIVRESDGQTRWVHGLGQVARDASGRALRMFGTIQDITTRKRAEQLLTEEKERLAVTLRSIGDGVVTTDTAGRVELLNGVAESLTGWRQDDARGQLLPTVFHVVDEATGVPLRSLADTVLETGRTQELTDRVVLLARDGRRLPIADSCAPIHDGAGRVVGTVLVFRDMTERQRIVEGLERAARLESVGLLAGGIAHDFNNLLSGLFGHLELARRAAASHLDAAEHVEGALSVFGRARALTQQLLTFAKGGAPVRVRTSVARVVREAVAFALSGARLECRLDVADDLRCAEIDGTQIAQVIDNLVINAVQASPAGGALVVRARNVELAAHDVAGLGPGAFVRVSVSDTGTGIAPETRQRIFEPFFSTKRDGLGLGLATAYAIVRKHGGTIEVESETGRGSTFHVLLPASAPADAHAAPARTVPSPGGGRVLLMDDEPLVSGTTARILRRMGYSVTVTQSGREALAEFARARDEERPFELVLLDLTVPGGMGGQEAVAELRKVDTEVPVVASSGYSDDPVMAEPARFGFSASLPKPYPADELEALLARLLAEARTRRPTGAPLAPSALGR
ncbi:MAG: PAS domain S-box protein [Polyangiaceae bacterium]|nr:PAS domain S-box protein [Polyangiaceae bacterium]